MSAKGREKILIVGARIDGQAGVVINALEALGDFEIVGFVDNTPQLQNTKVAGIPVIGSSNDLDILELPTKNFHVAIGDNVARYELYRKLKYRGCNAVSIIHPGAIVSRNVQIGEGSFIGPSAVINNGVHCGAVSIINSGAIVEHDSILGNSVHIAPGTRTGGRVKIGDYSFVGIGSIILPDITIGSAAMIGAGSTITKDVQSKTTMIGYAAKPHKKNIYNSVLPDNSTNSDIYVAQPTLPEYSALEGRFRAIINSKMLSNFSEHSKELEAQIEELLSVKHALTFPNLTSGLMLVFKAMDLKGEVILPSFTFSATGHALMWNGIKPIFADIDPETFNVDPADVERKITAKTSAILGVHIFGNPCKIEELQKLAGAYNLRLVFDSAHALGAKYQNRLVGGFGNVEGFSLSGTKVITSAEGGIVTSNDDELIEKINFGRNYGARDDYNCQYIGLNGKMSEFHAAIGLECLPLMQQSIANRNNIVKLYRERFAEMRGITLQTITPNCISTYKDFGILINEDKFGIGRDILQAELAHQKIFTKKYFYPPLHQMDAYKSFSPADGLPNTEFVSRNILCLPMYSHMSLDAGEKICYAIHRIQAKYR